MRQGFFEHRSRQPVTAEPPRGERYGVMTSVRLILRELAVAVISAEVGLCTRRVFTLKTAVVCPSGTSTLAGTVASGLLLDSSTRTPPSPAARSSVTCAFTCLPPLTGLGISSSSAGRGGGGAFG